MLEQGDKILIVHRRLFEKDTPRFFVGEVQAYEDGLAKVKGYTFVKDLFSGSMKKKPDLRTKVMSIVSGTFIVYQLPVTVLLDSVSVLLNQVCVPLNQRLQFLELLLGHRPLGAGTL